MRIDTVSGKLSTDSLDTDKVDISSTIKGLYRVGDIVVTMSTENPSTKFGGSWINIGQGRTLVGHDPNDTDFSTIDKIGGYKTHNLTIKQLPAHGHYIPNYTHTHTIGITKKDISYSEGSVRGSFITGLPDWGSPVPTSSVRVGSEDTGSIGSGQEHNNVQPYLVVYFWKRVS